MKSVRCLLVALVLGGFAWSLFAQIAPPPTGKMAWDLFQEAVAGQRTKSAGQPVPTISALFTTTRAVTEEDLSDLQDLGYTIVGAFGRFVLVEGPADLYADAERGVEGLGFVANAALPPLPFENRSAAITDGTDAVRAEAAWTEGYRGQGQRVAVIDSGFDPDDPTLQGMNPTYYTVIPLALVPNAYMPVPGVPGGRSDHGTACAIIVGDVAPEAELFLLSPAPGTSFVGWLAALDFAVHRLGASVVSTSIGHLNPTCHADGSGPLNDAVDGVLEGTEAVLVISAGNWAAGSGSDRWFYASTFTDSDGDRQHDFTVSTDVWVRNTLRFEGQRGMSISIILEWDDWNSETRSLDLDLFLYDADYRQLLAQSRTQQYGGTADPFERVDGQLPYTGAYAIVIEDRAARWHGQESRPVSFHLNVYSANGVFGQVEHHTSCGSVREVATNPNPWVIAVGAVAVGDGAVRDYSSRGPTASGNTCPVVFAPDGILGTPYPIFYGTSASAPYVAGVIALLRSTGSVQDREDLVAILRGSILPRQDECQNPVYVVDAGLAIQQVMSR